jgi:excisionase family DNA binding protein
MRSNPKVLKSFCTSQEASQILGVSLRTVQLWVESGLLEAWKTQGGHRRIPRQAIQALLAAPPTIVSARDQLAPTQLSILVVEDDADLRRLYEINLKRWPMQPKVMTAGDGYEALIQMGHIKPDLLIVDLNLPGMDGFRMLRTIRNSPELSSTSAIVVTGLDKNAISSRGELPPDVPVLPKPVPFAALQEMAEKMITRIPT